MNYENFKPGFNKPTIIMGQQYGIKVSVELDHSDTDIDQLFDAFETICVGLGYHADSWKKWIIDRADEYRETDAEDLKEKLEAWKFEDDNIVVRHGYNKDSEGFEDYKGQFDDWKNETPNDRYRATEEDEDEFDDYGARIVTDSSFEWGDEPENEDGDSWFDSDNTANEKLVEGKEKYDKALKALTKKQKQNENKTKKRNTKG